MPPLTTLRVTTDRLRYPTEVDDSAPQSTCPKAQVDNTASKRKEENEAIDHAVDEWVSYTMAKAAELGEKFDKKHRYFLDRFFLGGQKLIYKRNVTNTFNAFKSVKAAQLRSEGSKENAILIQKNYKVEYDALTSEQRVEYVTQFEASKETSAHIRRHTSRGCIQDVGNVARNMQILLESLKTRVGVEGFFCIVRNNTEFHVNPTWYFTSKQLAEYMPVAIGKKWEADKVASKLEAFAIAGCDVINLNRTSQQKALYMKREIANLIGNNLVSITGNPKAAMQYSNYQEAIVLKYGIQLVGWTNVKFCNPSELSNSLGDLRVLLTALQDGSCAFVKLSPAEHRAYEAKYRADVASGALTVKQRKPRKDAGTKRKSTANPMDARKRVRSEQIVDHSDEESSQPSL